MQKETQKNNRKCAVSGELKPKSELIRFVIGPENQLIADMKEKLPGRGLWITANQSILKCALKKQVFARAFGQKVEIVSDYTDFVGDLLAKVAIGRLKMANKAGEAIYGYTKLMAAVEKGTIIALFHASDAENPSQGKLGNKFASQFGNKFAEGQHLQSRHPNSANASNQDNTMADLDKSEPITCYTGEELSLAFGAANVIHAGLLQGGAAQAAITATQKYVAYKVAI